MELDIEVKKMFLVNGEAFPTHQEAIKRRTELKRLGFIKKVQDEISQILQDERHEDIGHITTRIVGHLFREYDIREKPVAKVPSKLL